MGKTIRSDVHYRALIALLRRLREDADLTQAELAKRLDRPQSYVSKVEVGERRLDVAELRALTDALGLEVVEVVREWVSSLPRSSSTSNKRSR